MAQKLCINFFKHFQEYLYNIIPNKLLVRLKTCYSSGHSLHIHNGSALLFSVDKWLWSTQTMASTIFNMATIIWSFFERSGQVKAATPLMSIAYPVQKINGTT